MMKSDSKNDLKEWLKIISRLNSYFQTLLLLILSFHLENIFQDVWHENSIIFDVKSRSFSNNKQNFTESYK